MRATTFNNAATGEAALKILESLAKLCAIAAGVLLTVITLTTCVSLIGRNTIGRTIVGDFELSAAAAGAAIALFLPWCQLRRAVVRADAGVDDVAHDDRRAQRVEVAVGHDDDRLSRVDHLHRDGAADGAVRRDRDCAGVARVRSRGA